jgi:hypothetical protein
MKATGLALECPAIGPDLTFPFDAGNGPDRRFNQKSLLCRNNQNILTRAAENKH